MTHGITFKYGETVNYKGNPAEVVFATGLCDKITIRLEDGTVIGVDKNDLFGMNRDKDVETSLDKRIEYYTKEIEENKNFIKVCQEIWADANENIKEMKNKMATYLSSLGLSHAFQITEASQKKEYKAMRNECSDYKMAQIRASADILNTAHDTGSMALARGDIQNQQLLFTSG